MQTPHFVILTSSHCCDIFLTLSATPHRPPVMSSSNSSEKMDTFYPHMSEVIDELSPPRTGTKYGSRRSTMAWNQTGLLALQASLPSTQSKEAGPSFLRIGSMTLLRPVLSGSPRITMYRRPLPTAAGQLKCGHLGHFKDSFLFTNLRSAE